MASPPLTHEEFFEKLGDMFNHRKGSDHGAVHLSQKRYSPDEDTPEASIPSKPLPLLVRASNGKSKRDRSNKTKVSTVVEPHDIEAFYTRYAEVCKAGMLSLKPRDRSKKKAKAKKKTAAS